MVAHTLVQVNRLWRDIAEQFLYSAFYFGKEEWRVQRFIDTIKSKPNLAGQLRTLGIMPCIHDRTVAERRFRPLFEQVLSHCHGIAAIMVYSHSLEASLPLLQSPESGRRLLLLSACNQKGEEFSTFVRNFDQYANLQVLELSMSWHHSDLHFSEAGAGRSFPALISFPSLHTLLLGDLDWYAYDVVLQWELPSLRELGLYMSDTERVEFSPIIWKSYQRLTFLDVSVHMLNYSCFHDITQAPTHLKNVTLRMTEASSSPPTHPGIKIFFHNVVTLGICNLTVIRMENKPLWLDFVSDPTNMPHLHSVLTDMPLDSYFGYLEHPSSPVIDFLHSLDAELSSRGVVFKGVMGDHSSFYFFNETPTRSVCPCFVVDWCSSPYQRPSEGHQSNTNFYIKYISDVNVL